MGYQHEPVKFARAGQCRERRADIPKPHDALELRDYFLLKESLTALDVALGVIPFWLPV